MSLPEAYLAGWRIAFHAARICRGSNDNPHQLAGTPAGRSDVRASSPLCASDQQDFVPAHVDWIAQ